MTTIRAIYQGNLRCESEHLKSSVKLVTDAPTDNRGKGESFSPTDLIASSLLTCMLTVMGIKAMDNNLNIEGSYGSIDKHMASNPRRIARLESLIFLSGKLTEKERRQLEKIAINCPVALSLDPSLEQITSFKYLDDQN